MENRDQPVELQPVDLRVPHERPQHVSQIDIGQFPTAGIENPLTAPRGHNIGVVFEGESPEIGIVETVFPQQTGRPAAPPPFTGHPGAIPEALRSHQYEASVVGINEIPTAVESPEAEVSRTPDDNRRFLQVAASAPPGQANPFRPKIAQTVDNECPVRFAALPAGIFQIPDFLVFHRTTVPVRHLLPEAGVAEAESHRQETYSDFHHSVFSV